MDNFFLAAKSRSGRPGWSVIFRHPLRRDTRGKAGLKIRRGLGTTDDADADALVEQLNGLLADRRWWDASRRTDAERIFAAPVVAAFFDGLEAGRLDAEQLREGEIPLPGREEGYARVLLVGTTGAGKTTLLRQLIGSRHEQDRFPSTSTAKTTVADMEIVTAPGRYRAAVTFMSEFEVRAHIDECIEAACLAVVEGQGASRVLAALLTHREQRFRLGYLLGDGERGDGDGEDDEDDFAFEPGGGAASPIAEDEAVTAEERRGYVRRLAEIVQRIRDLSRACATAVVAELGPYAEQGAPDAQAEWLERFTDALFDAEGFARLSLDLKDEVESRFDRLDPAGLVRSSTGWPELWRHESHDHAAFLQQVRWFTSNHFRQFGRLLTPVVGGIRVRGPFYPVLPELRGAERLVLIDSQGLGHTATDAMGSISTAVTRRCAEVDVILLVDSAQQPMLAAPLALMRAVGSAGYTDKLFLAFTHFDQVKGDSLHTVAQKRAHVMASVANALSGLRQWLGMPVAVALERQLERRVFLYGGLDRDAGLLPPFVLRELKHLLTALQGRAEPDPVVEAAPVYAIGGLELALRDAVDGFHHPWQARLGLAFRDGVRPEHWTRVKALARRFANAWGDEYDTMRPASDLIARLQEEISRWLDNPADWTRPPRDEAERAAALDAVRRAVFAALHDLVRHRLAEERRPAWTQAYDESGRNSGERRAVGIRRIYEESAPPISSAMKPDARAFLNAVVALIRSAVDAAGGRFQLTETP